MRTRIMIATALAGLALGLTVAFAQRPAAPAVGEQAIRKILELYSAAYDKGDLATLMSFWADGAEYVSEEGAVTRGKEALTALFRQNVAGKGKTLRIKVVSLRLLRPDLAMLDGTTDHKAADGSSDTSKFTAVLTKTEDQWLILSVRDLPHAAEAEAETNASAAQLRQLNWLVGEWLFQDKDTTVTLSCRRTQKQSFMLLEQVVTVKNEEVLSLTQVIGWDPLRQQFRSWVFDSAGGFGEGFWERAGNQWLVAAGGVRSDGRAASATNSWRYVDANTFEWGATDREIDGEPAPDLKVRYTRKPGKK